MIGAGVGAYAAQFIVEKIKLKESLIKEIRITNNAIALSFEICNTFLSLKKQWVRDLHANYNRQREEFLAAKAAMPGGPIYEFQADLTTISAPPVFIDRLSRIVLDEISVGTKTILLTTTLTRAVATLGEVMQRRNEIIETLKSQTPIPQPILIRAYFGQPDINGHIDDTYPNTIANMHAMIEDCIYFSSELSKELSKHGKKLKNKYGSKAPDVNSPDFQKAIDEGLMPNENDYKDWNEILS